MEEALTAVLLADEPLRDLVAGRIHWLARPQAESLPAITLQRIGGRRDYRTDGPSGLVESRVQLDAWGARFADAKGAARAAVRMLSGLSGRVADVEFHGVFVDAESDQRDTTNSVGEHPSGVFRVRVDLMVWHTEE